MIQNSAAQETVYLPSADFCVLFDRCLTPIWKYGKDDDAIQATFLDLLHQLKTSDEREEFTDLIATWVLKIKQHQTTLLP